MHMEWNSQFCSTSKTNFQRVTKFVHTCTYLATYMYMNMCSTSCACLQVVMYMYNVMYVATSNCMMVILLSKGSLLRKERLLNFLLVNETLKKVHRTKRFDIFNTTRKKFNNPSSSTQHVVSLSNLPPPPTHTHTHTHLCLFQ